MDRKNFYEFIDGWVRKWRSLAYSNGRNLNEDLRDFLIEHRVEKVEYNEEHSLTSVLISFRGKEYLYLSSIEGATPLVTIIDTEKEEKIFEARTRKSIIEKDFFEGNRDLFIPENHMFGLPAVNYAKFLDTEVRRYKKIDTH